MPVNRKFIKESRFPAPAFGGRRLRSTACNRRLDPLVPLALLDLPNRGRRVACGSFAYISTLLLSLFATAAAVAKDQSDDDYSGAGLEEVIVTAQKREQRVNDVGITVNAFNATQLQAYGVLTAEDLEKLVPGLTVTNDQPAGVPTFTIRGVGFQNFSAGSSSTVGLYLDETNNPYAAMVGNALFDIERVEVLKGPQGDLYGRNTTAGQINFISRKPTDEFEAGVQVSYGTFGVLDAEVFVSGSISDRINGRLAVKHVSSSEGWQQSLTRPGDELGEIDELGVRGLLDIQFSDSVKLLLNVHYSSNQSENIAATTLVDFTGGALGPIATSDDDPRAADWTPDHRPQNDNETIGFSARLDWDINDGLSLTSITAYDEFERDDLYDTSGIPQSDADSTNQTEINVFSQELRLEKTDIEDWYLLGGSGNALDNSPKWQVTSTLTYTRPLTSRLNFLIAGDVSFKDDSLTVNQTIEGYTLFNARISISDRDGKWSLMAWGRNITNEYYYHSESVSNCCIVRLNGQPETYGVTASFNF